MRRAVLLLVFLIGVATLSPAQILTTLYDFCTLSNCADGVDPNAGLVEGSDGNFYGTTTAGGVTDSGTIFKITPDGKLTVLYSFCSEQNCDDGAYPMAALVQGSDGDFYGTTSYGATSDGGTVFKITPAGSLTTLYRFCSAANCVDGSQPTAGLVQGSDGNFYGSTISGGTYDRGTVFKITSEGDLTTLHSFNGSGGFNPESGVIQAKDGNFYGTTYEGGGYGYGVVFKVSSDGAYSIVHSFSGSDGAFVAYGLVQGSDGKLYGTTLANGQVGTVFSMNLNGELTQLHSFNGADGLGPSGSLLQAKGGDFFGVTYSGGANGMGTVYRITADGLFSSLYSFAGSDGASPYGALIQASDGKLYGTASSGGMGGAGTVFEIAFHPAKLTVAVFGGGLVSSTDNHIFCGAACSYTYNDAPQVTLSAVPAPGWTFDHWTGCDNASNFYCHLVMTAAKNVSANLLPSHRPYVSLTFKPSYVKGGKLSAGTLTLSEPPGPGGMTVALDSDHPGVAHPPSWVFIPGGRKMAQFAVQTFPVKSNTTVTITARDGVYQISGTLTVGTTSLPPSVK